MSKLLKQRASFPQMETGTKEQWGIVLLHSIAHKRKSIDRILAHLELLRGDHGGYAVDRLEHSLQTATRAFQDGRDEEYVVCALIHDIGDMLGCYNHSDVSAAILKPFVSDQNYWMVQHHGVFQGYYFFEYMGLDKNAREEFRDHPWFDYTVEFCELYDQCSFDPSYESMPLHEFEPILRRVMRRPRQSIYLDDPIIDQAGDVPASDSLGDEPT